MRIVIDTSVLVRAGASSQGLARSLLLAVITGRHTLVLSNEMLHELTKVLCYPRLLALHGLTQSRVYDYVGFVRDAAEIVSLNPFFTAPIRDVNDIIVLQTAIVGEADTICTRDRDFFEPPASAFLEKLGIAVIDDIDLMRRLRG